MPSDAAYQRAYQRRNKNRIAVQSKIYREKNLEKLRLRAREHYQKNKEQIKAHVRAYQKRNRSKIAARAKSWREDNLALYKERYRRNYLRHREVLLKRCMDYHWKNRERILLKMRERYRNNRDYRLERQKKYHHANKERMNASSRAAYWRDPEKHRSASLLYRRENLDRLRAYDRERSKWRGNLSASRIYKEGRQAIMDLLGRKCIECGYSEHPEILQLDHKIPKCRTGASKTWIKIHRDALENPSKFQILCPNCHALKTYRDLYEKRTLEKSGVWYRKKRIEVLALFGTRCCACGYSNLHALHLDHKVPIFSHKRSIPSTYEASRWPDRFQLLCYNCHVLKTINDMVGHKRSKAI